MRTFVPHRPEIETWKTNEQKNKGTVAKPLCTFDRLMAKYKNQKADSQNRPMKKRESTPPKREDEKNKQLAMTPPAAPPQITHPRVSCWGPPIPPISPPPQWGPQGVWVPYPSVPTHVQQGWKESAGPYTRPTVFSRLGNNQSSSSGTEFIPQVSNVQGSRKTPIQRIYVPKKVEVLVKPAPLPTITFGFMEAPVVNNNGPIVIEKPTPANEQDGDVQDIAEVEEKKKAPRNPKYAQPKWCPKGLNKTQRRKLQRARCKQQKREALESAEGQVPQEDAQEIMLEVANVAAAPTQSAQATLGSAKPTSPPAEAAKLASESAKLTDSIVSSPTPSQSAEPTPESAEPVLAVSMASRDSSEDFAATVAAMVGMEVPEIPDEEMIDYEASPE